MKTIRTNAGVNIKVVDSDNLFNDEIKSSLLNFNEIIFWSDDRLTHYFFDYKINDVWVSCLDVDNEINNITIDLIKL